MARYIDAELLLTDEMLHTIPFGSGKSSGRVIIFVDEIEKLIVEDVVPKSEVENILDGLMKEAREVADRYEKLANETSDYDYTRTEYRGCQMGALLVLIKIAELKNKYTEEGVNNEIG